MDSFELFNKEETLDGDEMPTCEECKSRRKCFKRYSFEKWPEILVVHLKRFAPSGSYRAKLASIVNVPVNHLDLRYRLFSIYLVLPITLVLEKMHVLLLRSIRYLLYKLNSPALFKESIMD